MGRFSHSHCLSFLLGDSGKVAFSFYLTSVIHVTGSEHSHAGYLTLVRSYSRLLLGRIAHFKQSLLSLSFTYRFGAKRTTLLRTHSFPVSPMAKLERRTHRLHINDRPKGMCQYNCSLIVAVAPRPNVSSLLFHQIILSIRQKFAHSRKLKE